MQKKKTHFEDLLEDDRFDDEDADSVTEDTLEFLSLDDDMIESYQKSNASKSKTASAQKPRPERYVEIYDDEEEYDDDEYDEDEYYYED